MKPLGLNHLLKNFAELMPGFIHVAGGWREVVTAKTYNGELEKN